MARVSGFRKVALWSLTVLLAGLFIFVGILKLTAAAPMVAQFTKFGLPSWSRPLVGVAEIVGAGLLIVPRTVTVGAAVLGVLMAGCAILHFTSGEASKSLPAIILIALLAIASYVRRPAQMVS